MRCARTAGDAASPLGVTALTASDRGNRITRAVIELFRESNNRPEGPTSGDGELIRRQNGRTGPPRRPAAGFFFFFSLPRSHVRSTATCLSTSLRLRRPGARSLVLPPPPPRRRLRDHLNPNRLRSPIYIKGTNVKIYEYIITGLPTPSTTPPRNHYGKTVGGLRRLKLVTRFIRPRGIPYVNIWNRDFGNRSRKPALRDEIISRREFRFVFFFLFVYPQKEVNSNESSRFHKSIDPQIVCAVAEIDRQSI